MYVNTPPQHASSEAYGPALDPDSGFPIDPQEPTSNTMSQSFDGSAQVKLEPEQPINVALALHCEAQERPPATPAITAAAAKPTNGTIKLVGGATVDEALKFPVSSGPPQLLFADRQHRRAGLEEVLTILNRGITTESCKDYPHNDPVAENDLVARLMAAFRHIDPNTGECEAAIKRVRTIPDVMLEICCGICIQQMVAAQQGRCDEIPWMGETIRHRTYPTFQKRYNVILDAMQKNKSICKHMTDATFFTRFMLNPKVEFRTKEKTRAQGLKTKNVAKRTSTMAGNDDSPAPTKKRRRGVITGRFETIPNPDAHDGDLDHSAGDLHDVAMPDADIGRPDSDEEAPTNDIV